MLVDRVISFIPFFVCRDNVGDFIAANRFSDLLVNVNLDETQSTSVSKTSLGGVTAHLMSGSVPHQTTGMSSVFFSFI